MNPVLRWFKARKHSRRESKQRAVADVVIVSFPKSGRTWLRMMLGSALCKRYGLPEERMVDTPWLTTSAGLPMTVLCHDGGSNVEARHEQRLVRDKSEYRDKKVVLLVRDPRDVVTSCYFQASRRRNLFRGSIAEFVRDPHYGVGKIVTYLNIWHDNREVPKGFLVISYEELKTQPEKALRRCLEFMGVEELDESVVEHAIEYCRFENMKRMEQGKKFRDGRMRPKEEKDPEASKVRKGKVGGYVDYLSPDDIAYCEQVIAERGCPLLSSPAG